MSSAQLAYEVGRSVKINWLEILKVSGTDLEIVMTNRQSLTTTLLVKRVTDLTFFVLQFKKDWSKDGKHELNTDHSTFTTNNFVTARKWYKELTE